MQRATIIRVLSGLMFLIFLCPFFQMCSDDNMFRKIPEGNDPIKKELALQEARNQFTLTGYGLSTFLFKLDINDVEASKVLNADTYTYLSYAILPLLLIALLFFSLKGNFKAVVRLSYWLLFFGITPLIIFGIEGDFDDIRQIKYGYYLFFINTIAIIVLSTKQIRAQNGIRTAHHAPPHLTEDNPGGAPAGI